MKTKLLALVTCLLAVGTASAATADHTRISDTKIWRIHNRTAQVVEESGRKFVRLDSRASHGMAWLVDSDFHEGIIEVELRGKDLQGQSFIGVAFRGVNDTTYDAVYFRPFNFRNADLARRRNAVQYLSRPQFNWDKLRSDSPGKYEQPVSPVPDPNGWFRARLVLEGRTVSVFVNDATTPSLVVTELSSRRGGRVGLWVDNGSAGDFAELKLTPKN